MATEKQLSALKNGYIFPNYHVSANLGVYL
jgi:hypothetical protein